MDHFIQKQPSHSVRKPVKVLSKWRSANVSWTWLSFCSPSSAKVHPSFQGTSHPHRAGGEAAGSPEGGAPVQRQPFLPTAGVTVSLAEAEGVSWAGAQSPHLCGEITWTTNVHIPTDSDVPLNYRYRWHENWLCFSWRPLSSRGARGASPQFQRNRRN